MFFFLNDVDITMDYAGSFDKYKVIDHLTSFEENKEVYKMEQNILEQLWIMIEKLGKTV